MKHVIRMSLALVVAAVFALPAGAVPATGLTADLEALWTTVLQAPAAENPFTGGDPCLASATAPSRRSPAARS